ncbi:hypothetical protein BKA63DRAFT_574345 [Paraphoma chrysanthemicola]|nr:hypothetical protein BKA63DRAFT_574345 [Paraphoma chrysanthemicola]
MAELRLGNTGRCAVSPIQCFPAIDDTETFAVEIKEHIFVRHDIKYFFPEFSGPRDHLHEGGQYVRDCYFLAYGGDVMLRRLGTAKGDLARFLRQLIERTLELEGSGDDAVRLMYEEAICNSLPGLLDSRHLIAHMMTEIQYSDKEVEELVAKHLPAAAAAVGRPVIFSDFIKLHQHSYKMGKIFPDPLCAAVANGRLSTVRSIRLNFAKLVDELGGGQKRLWAYQVWSFMIEIALQMAIRTRNTDIGNYLIDCILGDKVLRQHLQMKESLSLSMRDKALILKGTTPPLLDTWEKKLVLRYGSRQLLVSLLQKGFMQIEYDQPCRKRPLGYAVHFHRLELAQVLLDNGADINAKDAKGLTSLHYAAHAGFMPTVVFLIENGACPRYVTCRWPDVRQLCERATAHANGAVLDKAAWRQFIELEKQSWGEEQERSARWSR